jgi:hypothetical protein
MTDIDPTSTAQPEELDDFDVEGHGLRELALGSLSAATIVAGTAGVAMSMDNPLPGTTGGAQAAVAGVQADVDHRAAWAQGVTYDAVDRVDDTAVATLETAGELAAAVQADVRAATDPAIEIAVQVAQDPIGTTDRTVDRAIHTTRDARDEALATADRTVADATRLAAATVTAAQETADDGVNTADATAAQALTAVGDAYNRVDPKAEINTDDGISAQIHVAGKTVTVSAG